MTSSPRSLKSEYSVLPPRSQSAPQSIRAFHKTPGFETFSTSPPSLFDSLMSTKFPKPLLTRSPMIETPPAFKNYNQSLPPNGYSEYDNEQENLLEEPDWKNEERKEQREEADN